MAGDTERPQREPGTAALVQVRKALAADMAAVLEIYNEAVRTTTATYDYEPRTLEHRCAWFADRERGGYPVFVAETGDGRVIGWSALNPYHDRPGYRFTAENSVYVAEPVRGGGVGRQLLEPLIPAAQERGLRAILACIDADNEPSIRLHARFGFERVGLFRQVGFKFNRWLDVVYMERLIVSA